MRIPPSFMESYDHLIGQSLLERVYRLRRLGCTTKEIALLCGYFASRKQVDTERFLIELARARAKYALKPKLRSENICGLCQAQENGDIIIDIDDLVDNFDELGKKYAAVFYRDKTIEIRLGPSLSEDPDDIVLLNGSIIVISPKSVKTAPKQRVEVYLVKANLKGEKLALTLAEYQGESHEETDPAYQNKDEKHAADDGQEVNIDSQVAIAQQSRDSLTGRALLNSVDESKRKGFTEVKQCVNAGYAFPREIGKFRRELAKAKGNPLPPEERSVPRYRTVFTGSTSNREVIETLSRRPKRSPLFRRDVISFHGCECALCSQKNELLLQAAHIRPVSQGGSDSPMNGMPLCPTHHLAFDLEMIAIEPSGQTVHTRPGISPESLQIESGTINLMLNRDSLEFRWKSFVRE